MGGSFIRYRGSMQPHIQPMPDQPTPDLFTQLANIARLADEAGYWEAEGIITAWRTRLLETARTVSD